MRESCRFYCNRDCESFPCHPKPDPERFNCLFCYCPLYSMADRCGGIFTYSGEKRVKDCSGCHLPHEPEYYTDIMAMLANGSS